MAPQNESRRPVERVRGTQDSWSPEAEALARIRSHLEASYESFGFRRIEVPVIAPAELHLRKSGLDIISKLYAFEDQGGRQLCLRPELTASVVRAFVSQPAARLPVRLFSSGPVFRYERPSRGRFRQFVQSGVELIGASGALADAETIVLAAHGLDALGLKDYAITVGHVGVLGQLLAGVGLSRRLRNFFLESAEEARRKGVAAVRARLQLLDPELFEAPRAPAAITDDDVRQTVEELMRVVGSEGLGRRSNADVVERLVRKLAGDSHAGAVERGLSVLQRLGELRGAAEDVLSGGRALLAEHGLSEEPLRLLEETCRLVTELGVDGARLTLDLGLSRGLQYYTGMVFEIDHAGLGSESQLCGGGRYDDLIRAMGGRQSVPALGFAFGLERVALALASQDAAAADPAPANVYVVPVNREVAGDAGRAAALLRAGGVQAQLEVAGRTVRSCLQFADREGFTHVALLGEEASDGYLRLREMASGEERVLAVSDAAALLRAYRVGASGGV